MPIRVLRTIGDVAKRVWDNSGEDNIFFLAGGIAFNLLLAAVPFFVLLVMGLAYFLNQSLDTSSSEIVGIALRLFPATPPVEQAISDIVSPVLRSAGTIGIYSALTFVWFSTRLFGSLRTVLADVFDIESDRGIIAGKIFDAQITVLSTILVAAYTGLNAYLAIATTRGVRVLTELGLRQDMMGRVDYWIGRTIAFAFIILMFFALYKYLPKRRVRWQTALIGALFSSTLIEIARNLFTGYVRSLAPGSLYTGTLYALVIVVIWVYYAAMLFVLGGEVAQVYELRRVRRMQREVFET
jgi:membrane protein